MLLEDGLTRLTTWPVFPDPSSSLPVHADHHQFAECYGDLPALLDQSLDYSPIEQSVISQDDIYFEQFRSVLYEEITVETEETLCRAKAAKARSRKAKHGPALYSRFHKCLCGECLAPGIWLALPDFITTRMPYSGLQIDIVGRNSVHLSGHFMSLLVTLDESRGLAPTVAIIFHNQIKVLVRNYGGSAKRQLSREVDIISKPYTVAFRPNSVSFTSEANLLTYSIDKSGCKTKICKHTNIGQEDFVTRMFQQQLGQNKSKWRPLPKQTKEQTGREKGNFRPECPRDLLQKCKRQPCTNTEQNLLWSIEDALTIREQHNGSMYVKNEQSKMYLSVHTQNQSLCLQLANLCIILNKTGHLFVAHQHNQAEESLAHISGSSEMSLVRDNIELLSQVSLGSKFCRSKATQHELTKDAFGGDQENGFSISRVMSNCEQFAICGVGGLLVKHHNRRAGLNQKNLICLL